MRDVVNEEHIIPEMFSRAENVMISLNKFKEKAEYCKLMERKLAPQDFEDVLMHIGSLERNIRKRMLEYYEED